jgi:predicted Zn-dependent protease
VTTGRDAYLDRIEGMAAARPASEGVLVDDRFLHPDLGFSLRFPHEWQVLNQSDQVVGISPRRDGVVLLQLQGAGSDPVAAAHDYAEHESLALVNATPVKIGELPGLRAEASVPTSFGRMNAEITWVAYDGRIYRLIGGVTPGQLRKYQGVFRKFAQSFRPLTPEDAAQIQELHLRSVRAQEGETLGELSARTGNQWDVASTAVANAIFVHEPLHEGQRIKIARFEPYEPSPAPAPVEPAPVDAGGESDAGGDHS